MAADAKTSLAFFTRRKRLRCAGVLAVNAVAGRERLRSREVRDITGPSDPGEAPGRLEAACERAAAECRPVSVMLEVTRECNLECRHCYVESEDAAPMTLAELIRVLDDLASAGVIFLVVTGGEPFARSDFLDILGAAIEREFAVRVLTNATLVGDGEADALASLGPTSVDVSVYGPGEVHERVTGVPGSFERTRAGIERLRASGVPVRIKAPLMKTNRGELGYVRALAESIGAPLVFDTTMVCRQSGDRTPLEEQLSEDDIAAVLKEISGGSAFPEGTNLEPDRPFCSAGRSTARVTPSGLVTPCVALPGVVGSLRDGSFLDIWKGEALDEIRRLRLDDLPRCRECDVRRWCVRCPGLALVEDGSLTGPSTAACRTARIYAALARERDRDRDRDRDRYRNEEGARA